MNLPAPLLEHVGDLTVHVATPIEAGDVQGTMSRGRRRIIPITGGTLRGPVVDGVAMNGTVLPGGADFQIVVSETLADLEARYLIELEGGERIYVVNRALRRGPPDLIAKLVRGEAVDPTLIYFRCVPSFEVSSSTLAWMTQSLFVGTGARYPDRVEISLFRVA